MFVVLLVLSIAAPSPSIKIAPPVPVTAAPVILASRAQADRLARQLYPEDQQIRVGVRVTNEAFSSLFDSEEEWRKLEKEYPGMKQAVLSDLQPVLHRFMKSQHPRYIEKVSNLYAQRFQADELVEIGLFFQTRTGKKLASGITENIRLDAMTKEMKADPDKPTSYAAIVADHDAALDRVKTKLDAEDETTLQGLIEKPWFVKMAAVGPAMRQLDQDFTNEPSPAFEAEVAAVLEASVARFIAQSDTKPKGK